MTPTCGIYDYGVGNLGSVQRAMEMAGAKTRVVRDATAVREVDVLVLPGVGAFGAAMRRLREQDAEASIKARGETGQPLLGICLGMHLLYEGSEESPGVEGLGLLPGTVRRLAHGSRIGWDSLRRSHANKETQPVSQLVEGNSFFFCHNFYLSSSPETNTILECGALEPVAGVVQSGQTLGLQFHPERSQMAGLRLLSGLLREWTRRS